MALGGKIPPLKNIVFEYKYGMGFNWEHIIFGIESIN